MPGTGAGGSQVPGWTRQPHGPRLPLLRPPSAGSQPHQAGSAHSPSFSSQELLRLRDGNAERLGLGSAGWRGAPRREQGPPVPQTGASWLVVLPLPTLKGLTLGQAHFPGSQPVRSLCVTWQQ